MIFVILIAVLVVIPLFSFRHQSAKNVGLVCLALGILTFLLSFVVVIDLDESGSPMLTSKGSFVVYSLALTTVLSSLPLFTTKGTPGTPAIVGLLLAACSLSALFLLA